MASGGGTAQAVGGIGRIQVGGVGASRITYLDGRAVGSEVHQLRRISLTPRDAVRTPFTAHQRFCGVCRLSAWWAQRACRHPECGRLV